MNLFSEDFCLYCKHFGGPKNQSFRNKSGKSQLIQTKFSRQAQVKGGQHSGNFGHDLSYIAVTSLDCSPQVTL